MKASKTKAPPSVQLATIATHTEKGVRKSGRSAMYIRGQPRYAKRVAAYLAGDRSQQVSPAFAEAVDALGKRRVDIHRLTTHECVALIGKDLRWQRGPDGVLLWEPLSLGRVDPRGSPDFAWLQDDALEALRRRHAPSGQERDDGNQSLCPSWLSEWAHTWAVWGYRFASIRYDIALRAARADRGVKPFRSGANAVSDLVPHLRAFFLEYLPESGQANGIPRARATVATRWPMPEDLLGVAVHGETDHLRDDFWNRCCRGFERQYEALRGGIKTINDVGSSRSRVVQSFLDFVAAKLSEGARADQVFRNPFLPRSSSGARLFPVTVSRAVNDSSATGWSDIDYEISRSRGSDKTCAWISREYPHLSAWEPFAREYIQDVKRSVPSALSGLSTFFDRYLALAGRPGTPAELLDPDCAKRPIADEFGSVALLLQGNKDRVPRTLDLLSDGRQRTALRSIRDGFIPHILTKHCSLVEGDHVALLPDYWNPFANVALGDAPKNTNETTRDAMPYRWIRRLRSILVQGPHFCNWAWAQQAQQSLRGNSADWFEVDESRIDRSDPDCVWRVRTTGSEVVGNERTFYEMWSPVRWVALVTKLNTALRTIQVRVLDSGESDSLRFDLRQWATHAFPKSPEAVGAAAVPTPSSAIETPPGATGTPWVANDIELRNRALFRSIAVQEAIRKRGARRDPQNWMNGVLHPQWVHDPDTDRKQLTTMVYVNTNKTADARREGAAKGFQVALPILVCPLPPDDAFCVRQGDGKPPMQRDFASTRQKRDWLEELGENTHWWLAKLRDWQEKYNPIDRRIEWKELSGTKLVPEKSDEQYEMYQPTCFLFREPSMNKSPNHPGAEYPLTEAVMNRAWWSLLKECQDQLNAERSEGQPEYRLVVHDGGNNKVCIYDLHSIRVSIVTALIVEGKVPVQYVQALVGHSRLVMTIYYTKINPLTMMREISAGFSRATETQVEAERLHMQNATVQELRTQLAFNDPASALAAMGAARPPGSRNVVMWMRKLGGICPVGGVSHDSQGKLPAGCFNGGPLVSRDGQRAIHGPVDGGPGTCVNCRWFVTKMLFIGELQAIAENALYRYHEFKEKTALQEQRIESIKAECDRLETEQGSLTKLQKVRFNQDLEAAEAIRDGYMESAALDVLTSTNTYRLIQRLAAIQNSPNLAEDGALITRGTEDEVKVVLEQCNSAMLHAARICLHSEIHPEINAPSATLRAAMIIARKLQEEDLDPFALLSLPEDVQTRAVNAVTRHIASLCDPTNLNIGLNKAAALLESKHRLSEITRASPLKLREWMSGLAGGVVAMPAVESPNQADPSIAQDDAVLRDHPPNGASVFVPRLA